MITADSIRCANDRDLYDTLLEDRTVISVREQIDKLEQETPFRTRRRLLATSVRLSSRMAPEIHKTAAECIERLGVEIPLELFVFASPQHNAMCFKPEDGRLFVMFSSSLLEDFDNAEIKFVTGHELGHHVYQHHEIPIGYLLRGKTRPDPGLALTLFTWSRYAEISADRAGALCAGDEIGVARALFKLASGLSGRTIDFNYDDFVDQVDQMQLEDGEPGAGSPQEDWFSTHPFSPLRVKALRLFHGSEHMGAATTAADLELSVQEIMGMMEPNYLEAKTEVAESMRRLLLAGSLVVACADNDISAEEVEVYEAFFGHRSFSDALDVEKLASELEPRIERVKAIAGMTRSMQVVNDLCRVALADGHTNLAERKVLGEIATGLGLSTSFVDQALEAATELD